MLTDRFYRPVRGSIIIVNDPRTCRDKANTDAFGSILRRPPRSHSKLLDLLVSRSIDLRGIEIDPIGRIYLNFSQLEFDTFRALMAEIRRIAGVTDVRTVSFMPSEREHRALRALLGIDAGTGVLDRHEGARSSWPARQRRRCSA